jgi:hypothetical protein
MQKFWGMPTEMHGLSSQAFMRDLDVTCMGDQVFEIQKPPTSRTTWGWQISSLTVHVSGKSSLKLVAFNRLIQEIPHPSRQVGAEVSFASPPVRQPRVEMAVQMPAPRILSHI